MNVHDPVVIVAAGALGVGLLVVLIAIAKLRRSSTLMADPGYATPADELPFVPPQEPAPYEPKDITIRKEPVREPVTVGAGASAASVLPREVLERLDNMSQRLNEMQTVLTKQGGSSVGGIGQGFSPETIDKLMRIIGNVTQQVDVLQRSLSAPKPAETPKPPAATASPVPPKPAAPPPASPVVTPPPPVTAKPVTAPAPAATPTAAKPKPATAGAPPSSATPTQSPLGSIEIAIPGKTPEAAPKPVAPPSAVPGTPSAKPPIPAAAPTAKPVPPPTTFVNKPEPPKA